MDDLEAVERGRAAEVPALHKGDTQAALGSVPGGAETLDAAPDDGKIEGRGLEKRCEPPGTCHYPGIGPARRTP